MPDFNGKGIRHERCPLWQAWLFESHHPPTNACPHRLGTPSSPCHMKQHAKRRKDARPFQTTPHGKPTRRPTRKTPHFACRDLYHAQKKLFNTHGKSSKNRYRGTFHPPTLRKIATQANPSTPNCKTSELGCSNHTQRVQHDSTPLQSTMKA